MPSRWHRFPGRFQIVLFAMAVLLLAAELINGRFWLNDFRVYYDSAHALLHGEPLYGVPHGLSSGFFKYAPITAMLFVPGALLPFTIAAVVHFVLIVLAFMSSIGIADRLVRTHVLAGKQAAYPPLFLALIVVAVHLHRELHLGNINVLVLWLLLAGLDRLLSGRLAGAGALIGLAILAKPHFVVLLPLLALRGYSRAMLTSVVTVLIGLALPMLLLGASASWNLHAEWLGEMAKHNASLFYTGGDSYNNVDTLYSILHRALLHHFNAHPGNIEALLILAGVAAAFGALVLWDRRREREVDTASSHLVQEYFLLLAIVPSITLTDTNHFLLSAPLVLLILHHLLPRSRWKWLGAASIPAFLAYGGNWGDALGPFSDRLVHFGALGIGNIMLIALGGLVVLKGGSNPTPPPPSILEAHPHA